MDSSSNHKGSCVTDSSVNLFTRAPAWSTAALTSSPRYVWFSNLIIYLLRNYEIWNNESIKQQKFEPTKIRNNEKIKQQKYEKTKGQNNESTKQRKYETTKVRNNEIANHRKGNAKQPFCKNNATAKQRKSDVKLQMGDANQRDYGTAKQRKSYAKQRKDDEKQRNCETTKQWNNECAEGQDGPYPDTMPMSCTFSVWQKYK